MKKKITFTLPAEAVRDASEGWLLGSFNNWNKEQGILMKKQKDGSLKVAVPLEVGQTYEYRFLLSDGRWENDYHAQQYTPAEGYMIDNCIITVSEDEVKETKSKPAKKATKKADDAGTKKKSAAAGKTEGLKSKSARKKTTKPATKIEANVAGKVKSGE